MAFEVAQCGRSCGAKLHVHVWEIGYKSDDGGVQLEGYFGQGIASVGGVNGQMRYGIGDGLNDVVKDGVNSDLDLLCTRLDTLL